MPLDNTHQHSSADIMRADDTNTPISPGGSGETPTLAEVLVAGNDVSGQLIATSDGATGPSISLVTSASEFGAVVDIQGGQSGGSGVFVNIYAGDGAGIELNPDGGKAAISSGGSYGDVGELPASDGYTFAWTALLSSGSGAPGSSFTTLLYLDTTPVSGGLYAWNGAGYTKVAGVF